MQFGFTLSVASSEPQFPYSRPEGICVLTPHPSPDRRWLMPSAGSILRVHYLVCFLRVCGWPVGDGPRQCLNLQFFQPFHDSVEISPGPDLYTEPGKSLIRLRIRTRQREQSPLGFLLWFPRRELTSPGVTDHWGQLFQFSHSLLAQFPPPRPHNQKVPLWGRGWDKITIG